jgi:diadenosine tetraphosphate (Ap4A) HIT family hydrolase
MSTDSVRLPTAAVKRFDWIVRDEQAGPDPACDLPLRSTPEAIAIPTIGSIVPNWLLVVPRVRAMSMADLAPEIRHSMYLFGQDLAREMRPVGRPLFFEHGARALGNVIGCGVDQAHLHVLATEIDLLGIALADPEVFWMAADSIDPWQDLDGSEYYFVQACGKAFVGHPRTSQSQYFRKLIARAAGVPFQWDYKVWPNYENVRRTYERFAGRGAYA